MITKQLLMDTDDLIGCNRLWPVYFNQIALKIVAYKSPFVFPSGLLERRG